MLLKYLCILTCFIVVQCRQVTRRQPWQRGTFGNLIDGETKNAANIPPSGFIAYGQQAVKGKYPWMSFISTKINAMNISICGGALISDRHVLTAAHCVAARRCLDDVEIFVGQHDRGAKPNHKTNPAQITTHERYNNASSEEHDISVLKLKKPVNTAHTPPISLPPFDVDDSKYENAELTVAGWGHTEVEQKSQKILRKTEVNLKTRQECYKIDPRRYPQGHLCAGSSKKGNFCIADSGGPLMMPYQNKYYVSGIVSFGWKGEKCGESKVKYFTNVFKYKDWIQLAMQK